MDGRNQSIPFLTDYGQEMMTMELSNMSKRNNAFRKSLWTGDNLQLTMMSLRPGEDLGLEVHPFQDQIILIQQGTGTVQMGPRRDRLTYKKQVKPGDGIFVPAGIWHNLTNTGRVPMKLLAVYGPAVHPYGTVHQTKAQANMR